MEQAVPDHHLPMGATEGEEETLLQAVQLDLRQVQALGVLEAVGVGEEAILELLAELAAAAAARR